MNFLVDIFFYPNGQVKTHQKFQIKYYQVHIEEVSPMIRIPNGIIKHYLFGEGLFEAENAQIRMIFEDKTQILSLEQDEENTFFFFFDNFDDLF